MLDQTNLAIIVYPKLPYYHTCTQCNTAYLVNEENFYLYHDGRLVSLKCKTCYKSWRKSLNGHKKIVVKLSNTLKKLTMKTKSYDRIINALEEKGYHYLGSGASRIVLAVNEKLVVKIDRQEHWTCWNVGETRNQTEIEADNYKIIQDSSLPKIVKDLFLPVLASDHKWSIVPRASLTWENAATQEEKDMLHAASRKIRKTLEKYDVHVSDLNLGNYGIVKGKAVIIDYGVENIIIGESNNDE